MDKDIFGIPAALVTIILVDSIIIGLYMMGTLDTNKKMISAKIVGTTALAGVLLI
jgi:hypothetical protein|tara:strand:- start:4527 stop:4691 length:165 start_codon:yes stop_codon:yes gene_type:complete